MAAGSASQVGTLTVTGELSLASGSTLSLRVNSASDHDAVHVTGNATVGIRRQSMANSTWTYQSIQNRTLAEVHDIGELWAAVLWDVRNATSAAILEQLQRGKPDGDPPTVREPGIFQRDGHEDPGRQRF